MRKSQDIIFKYSSSHPWISFSLNLDRFSPELWVSLGEIKSKCAHLAGVPLKPAVAEEFSRVYLAKGALATTAIEGNTLSEEEVRRRLEGELTLPPSKEYLGKEIDNILKAFNVADGYVFKHKQINITKDVILEYNRLVLNGLDVDDHVIPGKIRRESVGVGLYRGCHHSECEYLLDRLCTWLSEFRADDKLVLPLSIIKAIISHVYLAWIHPFGDGNGRTARLVEYHILLAGGVPHPAAQLLSNFYNETRSEYYRQLDRASKSGGDLLPFFQYAIQGFMDGISEQIEIVKEQHRSIAWTDYVYEMFRGKNSNTEIRRRHLVFDLSEKNEPVPVSKLPEITPRLAKAYAGKGQKTISRDINALIAMGLVERTPKGVRSNSETILAFLPLINDQRR